MRPLALLRLWLVILLVLLVIALLVTGCGPAQAAGLSQP